MVSPGAIEGSFPVALLPVAGLPLPYPLILAFANHTARLYSLLDQFAMPIGSSLEQRQTA